MASLPKFHPRFPLTSVAEVSAKYHVEIDQVLAASILNS